MDDSYHYIAEIIGAFDICAIQEIKSDLEPLKRLVRLLGEKNWAYFVTDITDHVGGNDERMAFVYNTDKVFFRNLVGEIVVDESKLPHGQQLARSPFFAAFQAGWFRFTLVSAHIFFGKDDAASKKIRSEEIRLIGDKLLYRAKREDQVYIFLGDMNIDKKDGVVMQSLKDTDMEVPIFDASNMDGKKYYDQMAYTVKGASTRKTRRLRHGTFDWRRAVYPYKGTQIHVSEDDSNFVPDPSNVFRPNFNESTAYYFAAHKHHRQRYNKTVSASKRVSIKKNLTAFRSGFGTWSTHQMSDHLPIWLELETDYSEQYLARFHNLDQS